VKKNDFAVIQLHHQFPPLHSPGVLRNFFIAKTFQTFFKDQLILTGEWSGPAMDSSQKDLENVLNIERVPFLDLRRIVHFISENKDHTVDEKIKEGVVIRWFLKWRNAYPFVLLLGDGGPLYIYRMLKKARHFIRKHPQTIIYSSFPPYVDHFIAYRLKRQFPSLIWIADFRDLHVEPIYKTVMFPRYQIKRNAKMLKHADLITSVSEGLASQLKKYERPVQVMYNGLRAPAVRQSNHIKKFSLSYTGSLYKSYRDPGPLLSVLKSMVELNPERKDKLQIIYAGRHGSAFRDLIVRYKLEDIFENKGMLSRKNALELQQRTHVNVLLSSSSEEHYGVLTGKFYEYLAACNPILLLVNGPKDKEFEQIFSDLSAGYIHDNGKSEESLSEFLETLFQAWKTNTFDQFRLSADKIENYFSWEKELNNALKEVGFDD
jgi:glycosyltransferase involved in cell wall biosynthesis